MQSNVRVSYNVKNFFFYYSLVFLLTVAAATALCYSAALILDSAVELFSMNYLDLQF